MPSAHALRAQIETALAGRIPSALTPQPRATQPTLATGIPQLDELLRGGLPLGTISEIAGPECSGRTSLALSFLAEMTQAGKVCAWVDISDALHPESAAAIGVSLTHLLWVRCGVAPAAKAKSPEKEITLPEKYFTPPSITKGLHGGGFGPHPRTEAKGLAESMGELLRPAAVAHGCGDPQRRPRLGFESGSFESGTESPPRQQPAKFSVAATKPWTRLDQALRVTDLLLQAGGFSAIVLDMGGIAPADALRVPLATWFRYRAAAERTQACVLLLTQHACAKSSAGLVLHLAPGSPLQEEPTVFTGLEHAASVARRRFQQASSNVVPMRKPPRGEHPAQWQRRTPWAGCG